MTAYAIMDLDIFDIADYLEYQQQLRPLLEAAGGRYLARGGEFEVLEGEYRPQCVMLLEFPSMDALRDFYDSEAYRKLEKQRRSCSRAINVAVRGVEDALATQD